MNSGISLWWGGLLITAVMWGEWGNGTFEMVKKSKVSSAKDPERNKSFSIAENMMITFILVNVIAKILVYIHWGQSVNVGRSFWMVSHFLKLLSMWRETLSLFSHNNKTRLSWKTDVLRMFIGKHIFSISLYQKAIVNYY